MGVLVGGGGGVGMLFMGGGGGFSGKCGCGWFMGVNNMGNLLLVFKVVDVMFVVWWKK